MSTDASGFNWQDGQQSGNPDDSWLDALAVPQIEADGQTPQDIERASQTIDFPVGDHTFFIAKVAPARKEESGQPALDLQKVMLRGVLTTYESINLAIDLCSTTVDPSQTIRWYCVLPPPRASELPAYMQGAPVFSDGKEGRKGFHSNAFRQFVSHLGFTMPPDGSLPPEALNPRNWLKWGDGGHRYFTGRVEEGQPAKGSAKRKYNRVSTFQFGDSQDTILRRQQGRTAFSVAGHQQWAASQAQAALQPALASTPASQKSEDEGEDLPF